MPMLSDPSRGVFSSLLARRTDVQTALGSVLIAAGSFEIVRHGLASASFGTICFGAGDASVASLALFADGHCAGCFAAAFGVVLLAERAIAERSAIAGALAGAVHRAGSAMRLAPTLSHR